MRQITATAATHATTTTQTHKMSTFKAQTRTSTPVFFAHCMVVQNGYAEGEVASGTPLLGSLQPSAGTLPTTRSSSPNCSGAFTCVISTDNYSLFISAMQRKQSAKISRTLKQISTLFATIVNSPSSVKVYALPGACKRVLRCGFRGQSCSTANSSPHPQLGVSGVASENQTSRLSISGVSGWNFKSKGRNK